MLLNPVARCDDMWQQFHSHSLRLGMLGLGLASGADDKLDEAGA